MSWAKFAIEKLQRGETAKVRPRGHSMRGKVKGNVYLHLVKAVNDGRFLIGNNRGGINGWVGANGIYGIATEIEP